MARYWVGSGGDWQNTDHWSSSSGGAGGASVPGVNDDVIFDANSFTNTNQTVTTSADVYCKNMDWGSVTNSPEFKPTNIMRIYGSLTLASGMTLTSGGQMYFEATTSGHTITMAGKSYTGTVIFNGDGGGWTLQDDFIKPTGNFYIYLGTLNTNGKTVTCGTFGGGSEQTGTRSIILGSSTINCTIFRVGAVTGLTWDAGTSTIIITSNSNRTFWGYDLTYHNVELKNTFGSNTDIITGSNTFNKLTLQAGRKFRLTAGTTQTANSFEFVGTAGNVITIDTTEAETRATLVKSGGGKVSCDYLNIKDIAGSPDNKWYVGTHSTDSGNNSQIYFTDSPVEDTNKFFLFFN